MVDRRWDYEVVGHICVVEGSFLNILEAFGEAIDDVTSCALEGSTLNGLRGCWNFEFVLDHCVMESALRDVLYAIWKNESPDVSFVEGIWLLGNLGPAGGTHVYDTEAEAGEDTGGTVEFSDVLVREDERAKAGPYSLPARRSHSSFVRTRTIGF